MDSLGTLQHSQGQNVGTNGINYCNRECRSILVMRLVFPIVREHLFALLTLCRTARRHLPKHQGSHTCLLSSLREKRVVSLFMSFCNCKFVLEREEDA